MSATASSPIGFWRDDVVPVRTYRRRRDDFLEETRRWLEDMSLSTLSPEIAATRLLVDRRGLPARGQSALIRVLARCVVVGDCWEFQGFRTARGYGSVRYRGSMTPAHRTVFMELHGDLPTHVFVCHTCDNPPCCNPAHLFTGTAADNNRDRHAKGRTVMPDQRNRPQAQTCKRGHPFDEANTRYTPRQRVCRACGALWAREKAREKRALRTIVPPPPGPRPVEAEGTSGVSP